MSYKNRFLCSCWWDKYQLLPQYFQNPDPLTHFHQHSNVETKGLSYFINTGIFGFQLLVMLPNFVFFSIFSLPYFWVFFQFPSFFSHFFAFFDKNHLQNSLIPSSNVQICFRITCFYSITAFFHVLELVLVMSKNYWIFTPRN